MSENQPHPGEEPEEPPARSSIGELMRLFLRLGATAFGGPAAHIAMMRGEVVQRRKWLTDQQFLDLLGATNLIPGPNSTEMAIHLGLLRGGLPGLVVAGASFILPAVLIVMGFAWAYVRYGSTPQAAGLFYGIQPVIIAIVFQALWGLSKAAVKDTLTAFAGLAALILFLLGVDELALLFGAALFVMLAKNIRVKRPGSPGGIFAFVPGLLVGGLSAVPFSYPLLFFTFLKIGSVLYGSGYVLLAFLRSDFVERLGWLTETQLLQAIAVGQFTPGPLFTTATFVGYLVGGVAGALLATAGIFLPSFVLVALTAPVIPRLRRSAWAGALLDGVNTASLGLMAGVTIQLAQHALIDPLTILISLVSAALLVRWKVNATWLILAGGVIGLLRMVIFP